MDEKIKLMTNSKQKSELTNARVKKYRKKCTEYQQLNSSMQDDPTKEMQNKEVKENNAERKRAMQMNVREGFVRRNVLMS